MTDKTIIIGYGNIDRADDGVAFAVINELRGRLGITILEEGDTGLEALNTLFDSIFIPQLIPELMELITGYTKMIFIDAHVGSDMKDLNCAPVFPQYIHSPFSHHMTPSALLAFLKTLYQIEPQAYLVSVRGNEFDFRRTLSNSAQELVSPAVDAILELMGRESGSGDT